MNFVHEIIYGELYTNKGLFVCLFFLTSLQTWEVYKCVGKTYMKSEEPKRFVCFLILECSSLIFQFCSSRTQL